MRRVTKGSSQNEKIDKEFGDEMQDILSYLWVFLLTNA